ncbi:ABC transporter permease [Bacillus sp. IITD106]|nr:ABC transporter permease [Bacillus sp. IITD106]
MWDILFGSLTFAAMFRLATPIILTAMGGAFADRANIFNIGLESFMLVSAFFAMFGSYLMSNAFAGLLFGILSSLLMSCIFATLVLHFKSDVIVVGIAMNLSAWGFTTMLLDGIFNTRGAFTDPRIKSFNNISIPFLEKVPYIGSIFQDQNLLVYIAIISVIVCQAIIYMTPFGLRLRGVGGNEKAAESAGVNILKYKWISVIITGVFAGISGSFLSIGGISMFTENMSAGKGFLALAAIMIGKGNPFKVFLACLIFAYTDAIAVGLQSYQIPSQLVLMIPYVATIMVLFFVNVRDRNKLESLTS